MAKKHILIITYHNLTLPGGVESVINSILKRASKKGSFCVLTYSEKLFEKRIKNNIRFYGSSLVGEGGDNQKLGSVLEKIYSEFQPDIIYCHNLSYMFDVKTAKTIFDFFSRKDIPLIEHVHHAYGRKKQRVKKILNFGWDKIIVVSQFAKTRITPIVKDKEVIVKLGNSLDLELFKRPSLKQKKIWSRGLKINKKNVFLFPSRPIRISTGKIGRSKQLKTVLEALRIIKSRGFKDFCLVVPNLCDYHKGKKGIEKYFKEVIAKYGLSDNIRIFPRSLSQLEMRQFYCLGDIVLFPSLDETFGLVSLEGMAMGLPVIGAKSGGVPEIIKHNQTGILVEPENAQYLAKAIERLIKDDGLYKKIIKNALVEVKKYDLSLYLERLEKIWDDVLKDHTIVYLVRHGETLYNREDKCSGWHDTRLTKRGLKQIERSAKFFQGIKIDHIYSSDLKRSLITAKAISQIHPSMAVKALREMNFGAFEGKTHKEIKKSFPKFYKNIDSLNEYPKGESLQDLEKRLSPFLKNIDRGVNVICAHAMVNNIITKILLGGVYDPSFHQKYNEIIRIDLVKNNFKVINLNKITSN